MRVVITGSSKGIGAATAQLFTERGHEVFGIDKTGEIPTESFLYHHIVCDVRDELPDIDDVNVLVNNAGVQDDSDALSVNLESLIKVTEKYGLQPKIQAIINQASVSAHNGAEFPRYTASKGGVLSYTRWVAKKIAPWGATCNSFSFGGVLTPLNKPVTQDEKLWKAIMDETPLKKWASAEEAAEWIYFLAVKNKSMSGQDLIIDNLEMLNHTFVWPED